LCGAEENLGDEEKNFGGKGIGGIKKAPDGAL